MRFVDLEVSGFGIWSGLALESLSPQLTVIYGPNEAGKTTILECLRSVLYGFTPARRDRYLPPVHGGTGGGVLDIVADGQRYSIARHDDGSRLPGGVMVTGPDGLTQGQSLLDELLAGFDASTYTNVFSVALRELQELATLNDGEVADWLYDLATGLDGISVSEVLKELVTSRTRLLSPAREKSQLIDLVNERDALRAELDQLEGSNDRYWELTREIKAADDAVCTAEAARERLSDEIRKTDAALAARDCWRERAVVDEKLSHQGQLNDFPADGIARLENIVAALAKARRRYRRIIKRRQVLRAQRRQVKVNDPLWRQAARIEALAEHESWIASLDEQLHTAQQKAAECQRQLSAARTKCGLPDDAFTVDNGWEGSHLKELRVEAKNLHVAKARLRDARDQCRSLGEARTARRQEVAQALAGRGGQSLAAALDQQGQLVGQFRRRLQLDDRLDQLALHRQELEEKHTRLLDRQELSLGLLLAIAAVFVCGGGVVLAGLIIPWGIATAAAGGLLAGGAIAAKIGLERSAASRLRAVERQVKMLTGQTEQTKGERDELDQQLPKGGGSLTSRLQSAEAELTSLEELLTIDARRQAADNESAAAKTRLKAAGEEWRRTVGRWQKALADAGLSTSLNPRQVREFITHAALLTTLQRQAREASELCERCLRERAAVAARIEQIAVDAGCKAALSDRAATPLVEKLRDLRRALRAEEALREQRESLNQRLKRLGRRARKISRGGRRLARKRRQLFRAAGAVDESDFRRRAEERAAGEELLRRRAMLTDQIQAALRGVSTESEAAVLFEVTDEELERHRQCLVEQCRGAEEDVKRLAEQRGRLSHEQILLADDRRLPQKQLDLTVIEERLAEAGGRWRILALAEHLIESISQDYERNRQPEVLQEASQYLDRMTEGRYRRVWTPLSEQSLRVDNDERALTIDLLSTGAREQLFLALRLALVSRYARHGKPMPMVLDDVLVNFDAPRALAAAEVFVEFAAAGHQLLLFTCHEHIANLFRRLHCDVRSLPANSDASRKVVAAEPDASNVSTEPTRRRREKRPRPSEGKSHDRLAAGLDGDANDAANASMESPIEIAALDRGGPAESNLGNGSANEELHEPNFPTNGAEPSAPQPAPPASPPDDAPREEKPTRRHRTDPPHTVAPVRAARRRRWSAEEFEGELEDQVNMAWASADTGDARHASR